MSNTEEKSVEEQINATPDGMASIKQINYVISLYKDLIKKSITKSMTTIDASNDYINFGGKGGNENLRGKFAIHLHSSFIPANKEYTKKKISGMIGDALKGKFEKKFAKDLTVSCSKYVKKTA